MSESLPDPSNPDEAIPWIRENLRNGWTANSDAVRTLLAEYDRSQAVVAAARAFVKHRWTGFRVPKERFLERDAELAHAISEAIDEVDRETPEVDG